MKMNLKKKTQRNTNASNFFFSRINPIHLFNLNDTTTLGLKSTMIYFVPELMSLPIELCQKLVLSLLIHRMIYGNNGS